MAVLCRSRNHDPGRPLDAAVAEVEPAVPDGRVEQHVHPERHQNHGESRQRPVECLSAAPPRLPEHQRGDPHQDPRREADHVHLGEDPDGCEPPDRQATSGSQPAPECQGQRVEDPGGCEVEDAVARHAAGGEGEHRLEGDREGADRPGPRGARQELSQKEKDQQHGAGGEQRGEEAQEVDPVGERGPGREVVHARGREVIERRVVGVRRVPAPVRAVVGGADVLLEVLLVVRRTRHPNVRAPLDGLPPDRVDQAALLL